MTLHLLWVPLQPIPHRRLLQTAVATDDLPLMAYYCGLVQETEWATFRKSYSYRKEPQTLKDVKKNKQKKKPRQILALLLLSSLFHYLDDASK